MSEISTYLRIVHPTPDDDLVSKREKAIKDLSERFTKDNAISSLFKVANNLVHAVGVGNNFPELLWTMTEPAIHKASKSFVGKDNEIEMLVCSLLAALQILDPKRASAAPLLTCQDLIAVGLWSGLSFQPARREARLEELRALVLNRAMAHTLGAGARTRRRDDVSNVNLENLEELEPDTLKAAVEKSMKPTIDALRGNAAVDREEIDLLWWALSGWSDALDRPYDHKGSVTAAAIAAGLEAGRKVRGMPVDAHRQLLLRFVKGTAKFDLKELVVAIGDERKLLGAIWGGNSHVNACPLVFPLMAALSNGDVADTAASAKKYTLIEWANRALLESATLYVASKSPRVVL